MKHAASAAPENARHKASAAVQGGHGLGNEGDGQDVDVEAPGSTRRGTSTPARAALRANSIVSGPRMSASPWKMSIGGSAERSSYRGLMRGSAGSRSPAHARPAHAAPGTRRYTKRARTARSGRATNSAQALGRLPWFAPFLRRSRRLRPRFDMSFSLGLLSRLKHFCTH